MKVKELQNLFAQAIYLAIKDSRGYKYMLFADTKNQNNGNNLSYEDIKYDNLTLKVKRMIDTWIAIMMTKRNSDFLTSYDDNESKVCTYKIPNGAISQLLNFGGRIGLTNDAASIGEYFFETTFEKDGVDLKILSPDALDAIYTQTIAQYLTLNLGNVDKCFVSLHSLPSFASKSGKVHLTHFTQPTYDHAFVDIVQVTNPFSKSLDDIAGDTVKIRGIQRVEWLATSLGYSKSGNNNE